MKGNLPGEIRRALGDPRDVCARLELGRGPGNFVRQSNGLLVCCPWHEERTPSCSITRGADGTIRVRCHGCGMTGDVLSLIAVVHHLHPQREFRSVLRLGAELAGISNIDHDVSRPSEPAPAWPGERISPPRSYPPMDEVRAVWRDAGFVACEASARAVLEQRGLDVEAIDDRELARVIPNGAVLPRWARYQGRSWTETGHRLVMPACDEEGVMRSLRAWRIGEGDTPKRLPPGGFRASGLVLADPFAAALLSAGKWLDGMPNPLRIVIVEGEPDFLTWATRFSDGDEDVPFVFGIVAGAWTEAIAARIPDGSLVAVRTDHDPTGDRYALEIARTLLGRCRVQRSRRMVDVERK